jgi:hypothetical protein
MIARPKKLLRGVVARLFDGALKLLDGRRRGVTSPKCGLGTTLL